MARFSQRLQYERELIEIIESKTNFFGQRGTHSLGCDVLFLKSTGIAEYFHGFWGEVKTSRSEKINISGKVKEQYEGYIKLWNERRIITYYFYRLITLKKDYKYKISRTDFDVKIFRPGYKDDKWRVFRVDDLPLNRNGKPILKFFDSKAMTIDEFLNNFPENLRNE